jgi:uncharacterized protein
MSESRKFAADRMLARTARWLRLLGADTIYDSSVDGAALLKRAREAGRILLTRDKRLRTAPDTFFLDGNNFRDHLTQVIFRYGFDLSQAFTRCSRCNTLLIATDRDLVRRRVPQFVYASNETFAECPSCGRVFWGATHPRRMLRELSAMGLSTDQPDDPTG